MSGTSPAPGLLGEGLRTQISSRQALLVVLWSCGVFTGVAALLVVHWLATGDGRWVDLWFKEVGGPMLAAYGLAEMAAARAAASWFSPGERMGAVWRLLFAAGAVHAASAGLRHIFGMAILANPLRTLGLSAETLWLLREYGRVLGGTLYLLLLASAILLALLQHRRLGLMSRPSLPLLAALLSACAVFAYTLLAARYWLSQPGVRSGALWWMGWLTDPLLALLFFVSLMLGRSVAQLHGGMLARPWQAYFLGSLLTCFGSLMLGFSQAGWIREADAWPSWLVWHPAAAAFAAAPLLQLEAVRFATRLFVPRPKPAV